MTAEEIERARLRLDQDRLELEKARLDLERSFSKRYVAPMIGVLVAIVAGVFALAQVWVASIQKAKEIEAVQIQQRQEVEIAASERERRWKLDIAEFVFRNREAIFSSKENAEQQSIFKGDGSNFSGGRFSNPLREPQDSCTGSTKGCTGRGPTTRARDTRNLGGQTLLRHSADIFKAV